MWVLDSITWSEIPSPTGKDFNHIYLGRTTFFYHYKWIQNSNEV